MTILNQRQQEILEQRQQQIQDQLDNNQSVSPDNLVALLQIGTSDGRHHDAINQYDAHLRKLTDHDGNKLRGLVDSTPDRFETWISGMRRTAGYRVGMEEAFNRGEALRTSNDTPYLSRNMIISPLTLQLQQQQEQQQQQQQQQRQHQLQTQLDTGQELPARDLIGFLRGGARKNLRVSLVALNNYDAHLRTLTDHDGNKLRGLVDSTPDRFETWNNNVLNESQRTHHYPNAVIAAFEYGAALTYPGGAPYLHPGLVNAPRTSLQAGLSSDTEVLGSGLGGSSVIPPASKPHTATAGQPGSSQAQGTLEQVARASGVPPPIDYEYLQRQVRDNPAYLGVSEAGIITVAPFNNPQYRALHPNADVTIPDVVGLVLTEANLEKLDAAIHNDEAPETEPLRATLGPEIAAAWTKVLARREFQEFGAPGAPGYLQPGGRSAYGDFMSSAASRATAPSASLALSSNPDSRKRKRNIKDGNYEWEGGEARDGSSIGYAGSAGEFATRKADSAVNELIRTVTSAIQDGRSLQLSELEIAQTTINRYPDAVKDILENGQIPTSTVDFIAGLRISQPRGAGSTRSQLAGQQDAPTAGDPSGTVGLSAQFPPFRGIQPSSNSYPSVSVSSMAPAPQPHPPFQRAEGGKLYANARPGTDAPHRFVPPGGTWDNRIAVGQSAFSLERDQAFLSDFNNVQYLRPDHNGVGYVPASAVRGQNGQWALPEIAQYAIDAIATARRTAERDRYAHNQGASGSAPVPSAIGPQFGHPLQLSGQLQPGAFPGQQSTEDLPRGAQEQPSSPHTVPSAEQLALHGIGGVINPSFPFGWYGSAGPVPPPQPLPHHPYYQGSEDRTWGTHEFGTGQSFSRESFGEERSRSDVWPRGREDWHFDPSGSSASASGIDAQQQDSVDAHVREIGAAGLYDTLPSSAGGGYPTGGRPPGDPSGRGEAAVRRQDWEGSYNVPSSSSGGEYLPGRPRGGPGSPQPRHDWDKSTPGPSR